MLVKVATDQICGSSHNWLWQYPSTAQGCLDLVTANPSCDNTYFSWADAGDKNCLCVPPSTDCMSVLESHPDGVSTWKYSPGMPCYFPTDDCLRAVQESASNAIMLGEDWRENEPQRWPSTVKKLFPTELHPVHYTWSSNIPFPQ